MKLQIFSLTLLLLNPVSSTTSSLFEIVSKGNCSGFQKELTLTPFDRTVDRTGLCRFPLQVAIDSMNFNCITEILSLYNESLQELDAILEQRDYLGDRAIEHALRKYPVMATRFISESLFKDEKGEFDQAKFLESVRIWTKIIMANNPMNYFAFLNKLRDFSPNEAEFLLILLNELMDSPNFNERSHMYIYEHYFDADFWIIPDEENHFDIYEKALRRPDVEKHFEIYEKALRRNFEPVIKNETIFESIIGDNSGTNRIEHLIDVLMDEICDPSILELFIKIAEGKLDTAGSNSASAAAAIEVDGTRMVVKAHMKDKILEKFDIMFRKLNVNDVNLEEIEDVYKVIPFLKASSLFDKNSIKEKLEILTNENVWKKYIIFNNCYFKDSETLENATKRISKIKPTILLIIYHLPEVFESVVDKIRSSIETELKDEKFVFLKKLTSTLLSECCRMSAEKKVEILGKIFSEGFGIEKYFSKIDWSGSGRVLDLVVRKLVPIRQKGDLLLGYFDYLDSLPNFTKFDHAFHVLELYRTPVRPVPFEKIEFFLKAPFSEAVVYIHRLLEIVNLESIEGDHIRSLFEKISRKIPDRLEFLILYRLNR